MRATSSSQSCPPRSLGARASGGLPGKNATCPPKTLLHIGAPDRHRGARPAGSPRQVCAHPLWPRTTSWEQDRSHHPVSDAHSQSSTGRVSTPSSRHTTSNPGAHHRGTPGLKAQTAEQVPRQGLPCTAKCTRMSERHKKPGQRKRLSLDPI